MVMAYHFSIATSYSIGRERRMTMTHHATRQLAEFVVSTSLSHMPDEVVDRAKYFVLDYLGVALRGSRVDSSAAMRAFVDRFAPPGQVTIIGLGHSKLPAFSAIATVSAEHSNA